MVCVIILVTGVSISLPPNGSALGERLVDLLSHARTRLAARGGGGGGGLWPVDLDAVVFEKAERPAFHVSYEGARHPRVRRGNSDGPVSAWILFGRCRTRHAHRADIHSKLRCMSSLARWHASVALRAAKPGFSRPTMRLARSRADGVSHLTALSPPSVVSLRHTTIAHPPRSQHQISCRHACSLQFTSSTRRLTHQRQGVLGPVTETGFASPRPQAGCPDRQLHLSVFLVYLWPGSSLFNQNIASGAS
ncbi:hypothetical protein QBC39DRAFT_403019 [Podospora conica]|nr:hypothetical protein QBC39DRAFT_403019 [Schizothecium conicum]